MTINDLKASVSLRDYIEANSSIDLSQHSTTSNYIVYRNCPFCNHKDHFVIYIDSDRFCSFSGCTGLGKGTGDILDFIMLTNNVSNTEAIQILKEYAQLDTNNKNKNLSGVVKDMNKTEIKYNKNYDFTNECLNNIAIGTEGMTYYKSRGLTDDIVKSYFLGYTKSFNDFFTGNKELQKTEFKSADVYNYVIPNVAEKINSDGSSETYIDYVIFGADRVKMDSINKANLQRGSNFTLKKYKKVLSNDMLFNERYLSGRLPEKFNLIKYKDTNTLYIVEGQFDALIIEQSQYHAISLNGVNNINKFIDIVKKNITKLSDIKFKLMLDNDVAGVASTTKLKTELDALNLDSEIITFSNKYRDVNEFYLDANTEFTELLDSKNIFNNTSSFINDEYKFVDNYLSQILSATEDSCISSGFPKLDAALGGGFFPGVYVMGGTPGAGKTAIANVLADNISKAGNLTCMFSLELSKEEIINRSISQISFNNAFRAPLNLSDLENTALNMNDMKRHFRLNSNITKVEILKKSFDCYKETILPSKIIMKQDITNTSARYIRNVVTDIISKENRKPFVVVDYLQRLKSETSRDVIQVISDNIAELKQLSIDFNIPVLVITSYNRGAYLSGASMSQGKGSGDIEYTCDCYMGIQLKGCGEDGFTQEKYNELIEQDIRELEVVFLKNRNWKVGLKTELTYIPSYNVLREV